MLNEIENIKQNLVDAGCDRDFINRFMTMDFDKQKNEALTMLARQRKNLLDSIHTNERKIYCLDFLVNKIRNK